MAHRIAKRSVLLLICLCCFACQRSAQKTQENICSLLGAVKAVPFRADGPSADLAYNALRANRGAIAGCLVERITDTTPMNDPGAGPKVGGFVVGDLAFFLLTDFGYIDFEQSVPAEVRDSATGSKQAYITWVNDSGNRTALQRSCLASLRASGVLPVAHPSPGMSVARRVSPDPRAVAPRGFFDSCDPGRPCNQGMDCVQPESGLPMRVCTTRCRDTFDCPKGALCNGDPLAGRAMALPDGYCVQLGAPD